MGKPSFSDEFKRVRWLRVRSAGIRERRFHSVSWQYGDASRGAGC